MGWKMRSFVRFPSFFSFRNKIVFSGGICREPPFERFIRMSRLSPLLPRFEVAHYLSISREADAKQGTPIVLLSIPMKFVFFLPSDTA